MELLVNILKDYGAWGLVLVVLIYLILRGQIVFRYPRSKHK